MSNKVDKLFKEKLGEHSLSPSAKAWEKIEANLAKKNKGVIWFRVAAVLALVGLLTFIWIRKEKTALPDQMANQDQVKTEKEKPAPVKEKAAKQLLPSITQQTVKKENNTLSKKKHQNTINPEPVSPKTNNEQPALAVMNEKKEEVPVITTEVKSAQVTTPKSIKLTFSLPSLKEEVNEAEQAVAATEEKKSTLQKAVNDIRTGDVLGSLRDAKDDLFAWEFKKDKTKKTTLN